MKKPSALSIKRKAQAKAIRLREYDIEEGGIEGDYENDEYEMYDTLPCNAPSMDYDDTVYKNSAKLSEKAVGELMTALNRCNAKNL